MALPLWLDQMPNVSFDQEKNLLHEVVEWSRLLGWETVNSSGMDFTARSPTDVALKNHDMILRIAVFQKSRSSEGSVRIQSVPAFREAILDWGAKGKDWHIELGGVPMDRTWNIETFTWLLERLTTA